MILFRNANNNPIYRLALRYSIEEPLDFRIVAGSGMIVYSGMIAYGQFRRDSLGIQYIYNLIALSLSEL